MTLNTTTHRHRNMATLDILGQQVGQSSGEVLQILQIGTGLSIKGFGDCRKKGKTFRPIAKPIETLLRRVPFLPNICLENYETGELQSTLDGQGILYDLTICDINSRVLDVVSRLYPEIDNFKKLDITVESIGKKYDVVVAMNVLSRTGNGIYKAIDNIVDHTLKEGLICVDPQEGKFFSNGILSHIGEGVYKK